MTKVAYWVYVGVIYDLWFSWFVILPLLLDSSLITSYHAKKEFLAITIEKYTMISDILIWI